MQFDQGVCFMGISILNHQKYYDEINFGNYELPLEISSEFLSISVGLIDGIIVYKRLSFDVAVEKKILANNPDFIIHPVEPIFPDKKIAGHLLIETTDKIELAPEISRTIFVIIPVHLGVFALEGKQSDLIDIISYYPEKYTLYGDPHHGLMCRYFKSDVFLTKPATDYIREAVLEINLINNSGSWIELNCLVFDCSRMTVHFDSDEVISKAKVKVINQIVAETDFEEIKSGKEYEKSLQVYQQKRLMLSPTSKSFIMEYGLCC